MMINLIDGGEIGKALDAVSDSAEIISFTDMYFGGSHDLQFALEISVEERLIHFGVPRDEWFGIRARIQSGRNHDFTEPVNTHLLECMRTRTAWLLVDAKHAMLKPDTEPYLQITVDAQVLEEVELERRRKYLIVDNPITA